MVWLQQFPRLPTIAPRSDYPSSDSSTPYTVLKQYITMSNGVVKTWPRLLLRVEGACIFGATIWAYSRLGKSWWTFAAAFLVPDLGMAGYLANTTAGAALYNTFHTETPPILLLCTGLAQNDSTIAGLALSWLAHIGMDRMLGFGLKYGSGFGHTHLGNLGSPDKQDGKKTGVQ